MLWNYPLALVDSFTNFISAFLYQYTYMGLTCLHCPSGRKGTKKNKLEKKIHREREWQDGIKVKLKMLYTNKPDSLYVQWSSFTENWIEFAGISYCSIHFPRETYLKCFPNQWITIMKTCMPFSIHFKASLHRFVIQDHSSGNLKSVWVPL